jgi:WXG100 family type VII secretion target
MAGQFTTGSAELTTAAGQLEQGNQSLQGALSKLQSEVEQIESMWGGDAAAAFQTLMEAFQSDAKKLNDNLLQISQSVRTNAQNYAAQEEQAKSSISSITSGLQG